MATVKFTFLKGDVNWSDYGGTWISQKFTSTEGWDFWLVRELHRWDEEERPKNKYLCTLYLIAPSQFEDGEKAFQSAGWEDWDSWDDLTEVEKVDMIHGYIGGTTVWQEQGNNYAVLFKECQEQAQQAVQDIGVVLGRKFNALGATGADLLKGTPVPTATGDPLKIPLRVSYLQSGQRRAETFWVRWLHSPDSLKGRGTQPYTPTPAEEEMLADLRSQIWKNGRGQDVSILSFEYDKTLHVTGVLLRA